MPNPADAPTLDSLMVTLGSAMNLIKAESCPCGQCATALSDLRWVASSLPALLEASRTHDALREALEFYADEASWLAGSDSHADIDCDNGDRARVTLSAARSSGETTPGYATAARLRADEDNCAAQSPGGFVCTMPQGHGGDHVAHNDEARLPEHECDRWPASPSSSAVR